LTETAAVFPSKGEMRKLVQSGGVSINKEKLENRMNCLTLRNCSTANIYWYKREKELLFTDR